MKQKTSGINPFEIASIIEILDERTELNRMIQATKNSSCRHDQYMHKILLQQFYNVVDSNRPQTKQTNQPSKSKVVDSDDSDDVTHSPLPVVTGGSVQTNLKNTQDQAQSEGLIQQTKKKFKNKQSIEMYSSGSRVSISQYQPSQQKKNKQQKSVTFNSTLGDQQNEANTVVLRNQTLEQISNDFQADQNLKKLARGALSMDQGKQTLRNHGLYQFQMQPQYHNTQRQEDGIGYEFNAMNIYNNDEGIRNSVWLPKSHSQDLNSSPNKRNEFVNHLNLNPRLEQTDHKQIENKMNINQNSYSNQIEMHDQAFKLVNTDQGQQNSSQFQINASNINQKQSSFIEINNLDAKLTANKENNIDTQAHIHGQEVDGNQNQMGDQLSHENGHSHDKIQLVESMGHQHDQQKETHGHSHQKVNSQQNQHGHDQGHSHKIKKDKGHGHSHDHVNKHGHVKAHSHEPKKSNEHGHDQQHEHNHGKIHGHKEKKGHGHGHGKSHDHGHKHDHGSNKKEENGEINGHEDGHGHDHGHSHNHGHGHGHGHGHDHGDDDESHSHSHNSDALRQNRCSSINQINHLASLLKNIKFFSDRQITKQSDLVQVALCLLVERFDKEQVVFNYGDAGQKFYIILQGSVGVDIPIRLKVPQDVLKERIEKQAQLKEQLQNQKSIYKQQESKIQQLIRICRQEVIKQKMTAWTSKSMKDFRVKQPIQQPILPAKVVEKKQIQSEPVKLKVQQTKVNIKSKRESSSDSTLSEEDTHEIRQSNKKQLANKKAQLQDHIKKIKSSQLLNMPQNKKKKLVSQVSVNLKKKQNPMKFDQEYKQNQQLFLREQLAQFKMIQSTTAKLEQREDYEHLEFDPPEIVEDLPSMRNLSQDNQNLIETDFSEDQKKILIMMMIQNQELEKSIQDLTSQISQISVSENQTHFKRVVVLKPGDSFGELALIDSRKGQRQATITCLQESTMAVINAEDYQRMLAKIEKKKRNQLVEFICDMPYFKGMHRIQINKLINSFGSQIFQRGQYVLREGYVASLTPDPNIRTSQGDTDEKIKKDDERKAPGQLLTKGTRQSSDYIYFVMSGEFTATQNQRIVNNGMDGSEFESKNNRDYVQVQKECFIKQQINNEQTAFQKLQYDKDPYGLKNVRRINTSHKSKSMKNMTRKEYEAMQMKQNVISETDAISGNQNKFSVKQSVRAKFSNKINRLTKMQNLTSKKIDFQECEIARYGPGKVFGEAPLVMPEQFRNYQPISVKCSSIEGEIIRISALEFEKKILSIPEVQKCFRQATTENVINNMFLKLSRQQTVNNFFNQKGDEFTDKNINESYLQKMSYLKSSKNHMIEESQKVEGFDHIDFHDMKHMVFQQDSFEKLDQSKKDKQNQIKKKISQKEQATIEPASFQSKQQIMETVKDKRDALKQSVQDYPDLKKVTDLKDVQIFKFCDRLNTQTKSPGRNQFNSPQKSIYNGNQNAHELNQSVLNQNRLSSAYQRQDSRIQIQNGQNQIGPIVQRQSKQLLFTTKDLSFEMLQDQTQSQYDHSKLTKRMNILESTDSLPNQLDTIKKEDLTTINQQQLCNSNFNSQNVYNGNIYNSRTPTMASRGNQVDSNSALDQTFNQDEQIRVKGRNQQKLGLKTNIQTKPHSAVRNQLHGWSAVTSSYDFGRTCQAYTHQKFSSANRSNYQRFNQRVGPQSTKHQTNSVAKRYSIRVMSAQNGSKNSQSQLQVRQQQQNQLASNQMREYQSIENLNKIVSSTDNIKGLYNQRSMELTKNKRMNYNTVFNGSRNMQVQPVHLMNEFAGPGLIGPKIIPQHYQSSSGIQMANQQQINSLLITNSQPIIWQTQGVQSQTQINEQRPIGANSRQFHHKSRYLKQSKSNLKSDQVRESTTYKMPVACTFLRR